MKADYLSGDELDLAAGKRAGLDVVKSKSGVVYRSGHTFCPTMYWEQCGPIIAREGISIFPSGKCWGAQGLVRRIYHGDTPLIAAMRCYVGETEEQSK